MGQFKVQQLLNDTIITLCQNAMKYDVDLQIDGLIGITVDKKEVVLVKINEFFENPKHIEAVTVTEPESERPVPEISSSPRKRKRRRSSTQSYTSDNVPETVDRAPHPGVPSGQDNNFSDDSTECVVVKQEHNDTVHSEISHGHWDHRRSFVDEPGCSAWDGSYGNSTHNQKQLQKPPYTYSQHQTMEENQILPPIFPGGHRLDNMELSMLRLPKVYRNYSEETIEQAAMDVLNKKASLSKTAKDYGIPKSSLFYFIRRKKGINIPPVNTPTRSDVCRSDLAESQADPPPGNAHTNVDAPRGSLPESKAQTRHTEETDDSSLDDVT